jgi:hypothetical protein
MVSQQNHVSICLQTHTMPVKAQGVHKPKGLQNSKQYSHMIDYI